MHKLSSTKIAHKTINKQCRKLIFGTNMLEYLIKHVIKPDLRKFDDKLGKITSEMSNNMTLSFSDNFKEQTDIKSFLLPLILIVHQNPLENL